MTNEETTIYWFESAKQNVIVAKDNFKLKHYDWALFFWHLAIEKVFKGILTRQKKIPPPIHKLEKLAFLAEIELTTVQESHLKKITTYNLEAWYDDYKLSFHKKATRTYAEEWSKICEELYLWLLKK